LIERTLLRRCAQNRPIQVLQSLLPLLQQGNTLPDYLFVGDDDTWINPIRLVEQVKKLNPTKDLFIGYGGQQVLQHHGCRQVMCCIIPSPTSSKQTACHCVTASSG
jgi:hypothetical protein